MKTTMALLLATAATLAVADYRVVPRPPRNDLVVMRTFVHGELTNGVVQAASIASDYVWDAQTSVCYRREMRNGNLDYVAVTNINVRLPENRDALLKLESERRP